MALKRILEQQRTPWERTIAGKLQITSTLSPPLWYFHLKLATFHTSDPLTSAEEVNVRTTDSPKYELRYYEAHETSGNVLTQNFWEAGWSTIWASWNSKFTNFQISMFFKTLALFDQKLNTFKLKVLTEYRFVIRNPYAITVMLTAQEAGRESSSRLRWLIIGKFVAPVWTATMRR